jgi:hypothetical protein
MSVDFKAGIALGFAVTQADIRKYPKLYNSDYILYTNCYEENDEIIFGKILQSLSDVGIDPLGSVTPTEDDIIEISTEFNRLAPELYEISSIGTYLFFSIT